MPFATNGGVSRADMSGDPAWIEINEDQYAQALVGMTAGKLVSIDGGFAVIDSPAPEEPPAPEPEPPGPPTVVTRAQGKAALITAGLWDSVVAYVAGIADVTERALAEVALYDTQDWRRDSPFLNQAATDLGFLDQLDDWFIEAAGIQL